MVFAPADFRSLPRVRVMATVISGNNGHAPDDAALLTAIVARDKQAFHALYERYAGQCLGLAMRVMNDRAASEDVLQDAFLKIWHNADKFDIGRGSVKTWVFTVVQRSAIDALRRRRARPTLAIDAPEYEDWDLPDQEANVHESVVASISQARIRGALGEMPEQLRSLVELAYFKGMTHREIAEHLKEPLGTIHSRARQSINLLKKLVWNTVADDPA
jgi:RNA polymerase sigma-70 factor, ECF subfamily